MPSVKHILNALVISSSKMHVSTRYVQACFTFSDCTASKLNYSNGINSRHFTSSSHLDLVHQADGRL